jgi:enamine deaminase RidA (YjgF/YER057c/UK114 family)
MLSPEAEWPELRKRARGRQRALAGKKAVVQKSGGNGEFDVAGQIEAALGSLGITLPQPAAPVANYVPYVIAGGLVTISGQLCLGPDGKLGSEHIGRVTMDVSAEAAKDAARLCAINVIAQLKAAIGDLDRVTRCVRLGGFIASPPDFTGHAGIMNGASDLMVQVFGDKGRHARSTVGVSGLPLGASVEVEAMFEVA